MEDDIRGTKWRIVKDFEGMPKHSQGGVDITISEKGISLRRGGEDIKAANGLVIPADGIPPKTNKKVVNGNLVYFDKDDPEYIYRKRMYNDSLDLNNLSRLQYNLSKGMQKKLLNDNNPVVREMLDDFGKEKGGEEVIGKTKLRSSDKTVINANTNDRITMPNRPSPDFYHEEIDPVGYYTEGIDKDGVAFNDYSVLDKILDPRKLNAPIGAVNQYYKKPEVPIILGKKIEEESKEDVKIKKKQEEAQQGIINKEVDLITDNKPYTFVDNADDERYKAYSDSLAGYNNGLKINKDFGKYFDQFNSLNDNSYTKFYETNYNHGKLDTPLDGNTNIYGSSLGNYEFTQDDYDNLIKRINDDKNNYPDKITNESINNVKSGLKYILNNKPNSIGYHSELFPIGFYDKPTHPVFVKGTKEYDNAQKQVQLKEAGLYKGNIDGIWGKKSEKAWNDYNANSNIEQEVKPKEDVKIEKKQEEITPKYVKNAEVFLNNTTPILSYGNKRIGIKKDNPKYIELQKKWGRRISAKLTQEDIDAIIKAQK